MKRRNVDVPVAVEPEIEMPIPGRDLVEVVALPCSGASFMELA